MVSVPLFGGGTENKTVTFDPAEKRENIKSGEKHKTIFGKIARYFADLKLVAFTGSYDDLNGKPSSFPPSSHKHGKADITDFPSSLPASDVAAWAKASNKPSYNWSEIGGKPSAFTPASHTHADYAAKSRYGDSIVSVGRKAGTATDDFSFAFGNSVEASGWCSYAYGNLCKATGYNSYATGECTVSTGFSTYADGWETEASNYYSHTEGSATKATGLCSHATGDCTSATGYCNTAIGRYNVERSELFAIGNGSSSARRNAFSVSESGVVKAASTITASTAADYAEYFEWADGNPGGEDRTGLFVTLDGDKIRLADASDSYILGIVSGEPFVLGNGDCDVWNGMVERDVFGRVVYDEVPVVRKLPSVKEGSTENILEECAVYDGNGAPEYEKVPRINPCYDSSQKYIPRSERKEWSPVGMLGQLVCYDDGTCQVNGYCKCIQNGMATAAAFEEGSFQTPVYRVMERVSENLVKVLVK